MEGTVKMFNESKGFGFIKQDNGPDVFVHISKLPGRVTAVGDRLSFEVEQGPKGPQAGGWLSRCEDSPFVLVSAGECYTRTGRRVYVHPDDRVAVARCDHGYQSKRGHSALVRRGALVLVCNWGHHQDETPYVAAAEDLSRPVYDADAYKRLAAGWDWVQPSGRGPSYWEDAV